MVIFYYLILSCIFYTYELKLGILINENEMKKYLGLILIPSLALIIGCEDTKESELQSQFSKTYDITNIDMGICVEQINDDGFIVLVGSDTIDNRPVTVPSIYSLIKTDSKGEAEWTRNIFENGLGDGADWIPNSLIITPDGKYLIRGYSGGSKIFSSEGELITDSLGIIHPTNENGFVGFTLNMEFTFEPFSMEIQFLLKKYTDLGAEYWERNIYDDLMAVDTNMGSFQSPSTVFESQTGDFSFFGRTSLYNEESNVVLRTLFVKTDNDGNVLSAKIYYDEDSVFGPLLMTKDGGFIAANNEEILKISSSGNIDWRNQNLSGRVEETEDEGFIFISRDDSSILLTKTNYSGNIEWEKSFDSESHHNYGSVDVSQTADGGYIITSSSKVSGWNDDIILIKTDSNGDTIEDR